MRPFGFSTGAIAKGDFDLGVRLALQVATDCIELSALRLSELKPLIDALPGLPLDEFKYVSIHAPSSYDKISERTIVDLLAMGTESLNIVVHPNSIHDFGLWRTLGSRLLVENMDTRKSIGRNVVELRRIFRELPEAGFCFDIGHARQVDTSMIGAAHMLLEFRDRLRQVHVSGVTDSGKHVSVTDYGASFRRVIWLIPYSTPVIIESLGFGMNTFERMENEHMNVIGYM
jgi:hypothetical protein